MDYPCQKDLCLYQNICWYVMSWSKQYLGSKNVLFWELSVIYNECSPEQFFDIFGIWNLVSRDKEVVRGKITGQRYFSVYCHNILRTDLVSSNKKVVRGENGFKPRWIWTEFLLSFHIIWKFSWSWNDLETIDQASANYTTIFCQTLKYLGEDI